MTTFRHKLDVYYIAAIAYGVTFTAYLFIKGTLTGEKFEMVWKDPIVYLLAACAFISLIVLVVMAFARRRIVVGNDALIFETRFKQRAFTSAEIEWIGMRRDPRTSMRFGRTYPMVVMRLRTRRRLLRFRPDNFEQRSELVSALATWAERNNVELRSRSRSRKRT